MTGGVVFGLTLISALGCGLIAGAFFAFSTFVMQALERLPAPQGIAAMQSINITVINPWFLGAFLGTAAICVLLAGFALVHWQPASPYLVAGSALYLVGSLLVTMICNVPRNNAIAIVDAASASGAAVWAQFLPAWNTWNHVRTIASLLAAGSFTLGITKFLHTP